MSLQSTTDFQSYIYIYIYIYASFTPTKIGIPNEKCKYQLYLV